MKILVNLNNFFAHQRIFFRVIKNLEVAEKFFDCQRIFGAEKFYCGAKIMFWRADIILSVLQVLWCTEEFFSCTKGIF